MTKRQVPPQVISDGPSSQWAKDCPSLGHQTELGSVGHGPPLYCTSLHLGPKASLLMPGQAMTKFPMKGSFYLTKDAPLCPPLSWDFPPPHVTLKHHLHNPKNISLPF